MTTMKSFLGDQRGGTAILFGLMLLPLMAAVGAAVDDSRAANVRTAMQAAADAAALLLAREGGTLSNRGLTDRARQVFQANFHRPGAEVGQFEVEKTSTSIRVTAEGSVKTVIMGIFRIDTIKLSTVSEVGWGQNRIELALVLDNTLSMASSSKMPELKKAVRELLIDPGKGCARPRRHQDFNRAVRYPGERRRRQPQREPGSISMPMCERDLRVDRGDWRGCIADRDMPYDTDDAAPAQRQHPLPGRGVPHRFARTNPAADRQLPRPAHDRRGHASVRQHQHHDRRRLGPCLAEPKRPARSGGAVRNAARRKDHGRAHRRRQHAQSLHVQPRPD